MNLIVKENINDEPKKGIKPSGISKPKQSFIDFLNKQGLDKSVVYTAYGLYCGWIKDNS